MSFEALNAACLHRTGTGSTKDWAGSDLSLHSRSCLQTKITKTQCTMQVQPIQASHASLDCDLTQQGACSRPGYWQTCWQKRSNSRISSVMKRRKGHPFRLSGTVPFCTTPVKVRIHEVKAAHQQQSSHPAGCARPSSSAAGRCTGCLPPGLPRWEPWERAFPREDPSIPDLAGLAGGPLWAPLLPLGDAATSLGDPSYRGLPWELLPADRAPELAPWGLELSWCCCFCCCCCCAPLRVLAVPIVQSGLLLVEEPCLGAAALEAALDAASLGPSSLVLRQLRLLRLGTRRQDLLLRSAALGTSSVPPCMVQD